MAKADDVILSFELQTPAKIFLNPVAESLNFEQLPIVQAGLDMKFSAAVAMQQTMTDRDAKDLSINQRKCLFEDEAGMKYFTDEPYTISGCLKECKLDRALKFCGCVPPFYRPSNLRNSTFCDIESLKCLKDEKISDVSECPQCELACDFTIFSIEHLHNE